MNNTSPLLATRNSGGRILLAAGLLWASAAVCSDVPPPGPGQAAYSVVQHAADTTAKPAGLINDKAPEILVRVNGDMVTRDELHRVQADLLTLSRQQQAPGDKALNGEELEQLALRKLIQRRLILQEAGRLKLTITGPELDQAITALRNSFADLGTFGVWMQERGLDDQSLISTLRDDMLVKRLLAALVKDVSLSEKELQDYYASHKEDLVIGEEVRLRIIAVRSEAAAREILVALREGENFSRLARKRSLGLRASQGGDTGWVTTRTLPPSLRSSIATLQPGDASHPLQKNSDEFLIIGLQGRRGVLTKNLNEAHPLIERRLLAARQQETVQTWLREQEKQSNIEVFTPPNDSRAGSSRVRSAYVETRL